MAFLLSPSATGRISFKGRLTSSHTLSSSGQYSSTAQRARLRHHGLLRRSFSDHGPKRPRFSAWFRDGMRNSKIKWYQIPFGAGIGSIGLLHLYKVATREGDKAEQERHAAQAGNGGKRPKKRPRIRPDGPWQVKVMSTLPLKALSRIWGKFNELDIPYYLRVPGFRLYSFIFGVAISEAEETDLHKFPNLAAFFYRTLKPGARPLDPNPSALLSPADGRVLQFGQIEDGDIEQVKGMTYSLDALLGKHTPPPSVLGNLDARQEQATPAQKAHVIDEKLVKSDEEFAQVNGISYTLPGLLSGPTMSLPTDRPKDQSVKPSASAVSEVRAELALGEKPWYSLLAADTKSALYYAVIYLAPGDYHRFHSPANWVVERRRHFAGELYSVSPYLQRSLPGLFTLNERVVLLGRWRWGFFSFIPVGATNVGSIIVNFDRELRTNSLTTDTAADRAAEEAAARGEAYPGFAEATYEAASAILGGHAVRRGEEIGGFRLGSTIVLVFEAPATTADAAGAPSPGGWHWAVEKGQRVKMGQALGYINS